MLLCDSGCSLWMNRRTLPLAVVGADISNCMLLSLALGTKEDPNYGFALYEQIALVACSYVALNLIYKHKVTLPLAVVGADISSCMLLCGSGSNL